ncbi:MAG: NAD(P)/FAD-dependent oxidoreductase [Terriglobales bacterium]
MSAEPAQVSPAGEGVAASIYDLAVVGGGPAGCAAAWTAARAGLRVLQFEPDRFPRDKVCGEFISAEAHALLRAMAPDAVARAVPLQWAEFSTGAGTRRRFRLQQPALGLSRLCLDAALWEAARLSGVTQRASVVRGVHAGDAGFRLEADGGRWRSRAVIVAAGRWWSIAGLRTPDELASAGAPWLGIKARFGGLQPQDDGAGVEMFYFPGGYCGLAPVENGMTNLCCLVHRRRAGRVAEARDFAAWMAAVGGEALRRRLQGGEQVTATVTTAQVKMAPKQASLGGVLLAGDAAGFLDPFTGDGLAMALCSGELAGRMEASALSDGVALAPEATARAFTAELRAAVGTSYVTARWLRRLVLAPSWLQDVAAATLLISPVARHLVTRTRWLKREEGGG